MRPSMLTSGALDGKLAADEGCQLCIALHAARNVNHAITQLLVGLQGEGWKDSALCVFS